ncbi:MAG: hypothetical protein OIF35_03615 [Cellvibrionaceae bacterium]|nr:hypothetical protein [Cellvibrionaceae bacterium]MCV6624947.1 hypothetical protein [Cellvibrionaceae bacterium]
MEQRDFCFAVAETKVEYLPLAALASFWLISDRSLLGLGICAVLAGVSFYYSRRWAKTLVQQRRLHLGQSFLSYHLDDHILWHIPYGDISSVGTTHANTVVVINKNGSCFTQTNIEELPQAEQFLKALEARVANAVPHLVAS